MKKNAIKIKRDNGRTGRFRDKTRGRISVHAFSCHDDVWQEMEAEKLKRNMSVGQYLNFLHNYYKQNVAKNKA